MNILGINAFHADAAACLVVDGKLIAAAEEERFCRMKHWAGFPAEAVRYCLKEAGITISDVQFIALNRNPNAHFLRKVLYTLKKRPELSAVTDRWKNAYKIRNIRAIAEAALGVPTGGIKAKIKMIEHHRAHLASAFFVSPFSSAAAVSVDGFGDFVSTLWAEMDGCDLNPGGQVYFPHSLGLLYLAFTQYLGFLSYGDEYKVMGLAAYGKPSFMDKMGEVVRLKPAGGFELDLPYFRHECEGVSMVWEKGSPVIGKVFSEKLEKLFGPARKPDEPVTSFHQEVAHSLQKKYEEVFFHILNHVFEKTKNTNLCLAGGCGLNSVANGKILKQSPFKKIYIQPASGDSGGAIGAAFYTYHQYLRKPRSFCMDQSYWGPHFTSNDVAVLLEAEKAALIKEGCVVERIDDSQELCRRTASAISKGKVIGWFRGRMEWGPRALGNRSILCDPRRADMKELLNIKIKRRESFRPFAPSVLADKASEWFETDEAVPFMLQVYPVRPEKRAQIPSVTHVDGSGRLQTVAQNENKLYYELISSFERETGVPMLLNTSFNENEPIVLSPREALDCFLRTKMDVLVMENFFLERRSG